MDIDRGAGGAYGKFGIFPPAAWPLAAAISYQLILSGNICMGRTGGLKGHGPTQIWINGNKGVY